MNCPPKKSRKFRCLSALRINASLDPDGVASQPCVAFTRECGSLSMIFWNFFALIPFYRLYVHNNAKMF